MMEEATYTVRKGKRFSRPQPGCHKPNYPWPGIVYLFPAMESLVFDIPAGDGKFANLFLQCRPPERPKSFNLMIHPCRYTVRTLPGWMYYSSLARNDSPPVGNVFFTPLGKSFVPVGT